MSRTNGTKFFIVLALICSWIVLSLASIEDDTQSKLDSYKEKFEKKLPSWNVNGFGYQMGVNRIPDNPSEPSAPAPAPAIAPAPATAPAPAPAIAPAPATALAEPSVPETPSAAGAQAQAQTGTGSAPAPKVPVAATKTNPFSRWFAPLKISNWG